MSTAASRPWVAAFPDAARWDAPIEIGSLPELLDKAVAEGPCGPLFPIAARASTMGCSARAVAELSTGLGEAASARANGRALPAEHALSSARFFRALRIGARVTHLSPLDAHRELVYKLADAGAKALITTNFPNLLANAMSLNEQGLVERSSSATTPIGGPLRGSRCLGERAFPAARLVPRAAARRFQNLAGRRRGPSIYGRYHRSAERRHADPRQFHGRGQHLSRAGTIAATRPARSASFACCRSSTSMRSRPCSCVACATATSCCCIRVSMPRPWSPRSR